MDEFPPGFEWDRKKARTNLVTHGISFADAATAFGDYHARYNRDVVHSQREERFTAVGRTAAGRLVVVAFTFRGANIRLISARPASKRERQRYD